MKSFASDNYSGIHPEILEAIVCANNQHQISYGDDTITKEANQLFEQAFGPVSVLYCFNGTGANVLSLKCCVLPFQAIICSEYAHIHVDECGAPTQNIGASLITVPTKNGKISPKDIQHLLNRKGNVHHTQPKVISISQSTELGTVYSLEEIKALTEFAHNNDMYVHLDGARISNAVASLGVTLKEATTDCGIDIMSFGGTKNGLMIGEAVLIFNEDLKKNANYFQKQTAQLFSKNRFISCQFAALLKNKLWHGIAQHSNNMAKLLEQEVRKINGISITQPVEANAIFAIIPTHAIEPLQREYPFYIWDEQTKELRWMCSFDTTAEEIIEFTQKLKELLG